MEYSHEAKGDNLKQAPAVGVLDGSSKGLTTMDWGFGANHSNGARFSGKGYFLSYTRDRPWALMAIDFSSIHQFHYFFAKLSFGIAADYDQLIQWHFV